MKTVFPDIAAYPSLLEILEDAARSRPGEVAMALAADEGMLHAWSAPEGLRRSRLAAWRLYALGMRPGDRLLTWCPSGPELAALTLGAIRLGAGIGAGRHAPDVRDVQLPDVVMRTVPALVGEAGTDGEQPFPDDWEAQLETVPRPTRDTLFEIVFTSGTTAAPKGAMLSHGNILATLDAADQVVPRRRHRLVSLLPLSHLFGQLELGYALIAGAPILYIRSRNPRVIFEAIREHHVTTMVVVPQVLDLFWSTIEREVAKQGREASFARLRSIARRLPYALRRRLFARIHDRLGGPLELFVFSAAFLPPALPQAWGGNGGG